MSLQGHECLANSQSVIHVFHYAHSHLRSQAWLLLTYTWTYAHVPVFGALPELGRVCSGRIDVQSTQSKLHIKLSKNDITYQA